MIEPVEISPYDSAVQQLALTFRGQLISERDASYEDACKVWNGTVNKRPALIARCAGVADVIAAVNLARDQGMLVAVRGGGHSVSGASTCDGGLVIDLSQMKGIRVDPTRQTVRAEAGALLADLDHEAQAFGLATPAGTVSHTGIAGLTLGGGMGWLSRKFGLSIDNLLSVDTVGADGQLRTASASENPELFWGVRGAGSNFGVVTSFEYQLHPVGPLVIGGLLFYPAAQAREVLSFFRDLITNAPDELGAICVLLSAPPAPFVPEHLHGAPMVAIGLCYAGSLEAGEQAVAPIRAALPPALDMVGPLPYAALQQMIDEGNPHGWLYYTKAHYLTEMSDSAIDVITEFGNKRTSPTSIVIIFGLGGAVSRVSENETAFSHREVAFAMDFIAIWQNPADGDTHKMWSRTAWEAMKPHASSGIYINFLNDEGEDRVKSAYNPETYARLVALKNQYDPTNLFRLNANIKPTV